VPPLKLPCNTLSDAFKPALPNKFVTDTHYKAHMHTRSHIVCTYQCAHSVYVNTHYLSQPWPLFHGGMLLLFQSLGLSVTVVCSLVSQPWPLCYGGMLLLCPSLGLSVTVVCSFCVTGAEHTSRSRSHLHGARPRELNSGGRHPT
jgi:hypothetical protein